MRFLPSDDGYDAEELPCQDSPQMHLPFDWAESKDMWFYEDGEESEKDGVDNGCVGDLEVAVDLSVIGHDSQQGVSDGDFENVVHKCSFCGEEGHRRETCAKRKQVASRAVNLQTPRKGSEQSRKICSKCGGVGHNSRACTGNLKSEKKQ